MRFVKTAASQATPGPGRARARATSSRGRPPRCPRSTMARERRLQLGGAGRRHVRGVPVADRRRSCVSTVPTRPVDRPAASSAAAARNEVVVLPSVPVIPTTPRSRDGSPYHQAAARASAARVVPTTSCGSAAPATGCSTMAAAAPAAAAAADVVVAVDVEARERDEQRPAPHRARVVGDAAHRRCPPRPAAPIGRPSRRAPRTSPAARRRSIRGRQRGRGPAGSAAASSAAILPVVARSRGARSPPAPRRPARDRRVRPGRA